MSGFIPKSGDRVLDGNHARLPITNNREGVIRDQWVNLAPPSVLIQNRAATQESSLNSVIRKILLANEPVEKIFDVASQTILEEFDITEEEIEVNILPTHLNRDYIAVYHYITRNINSEMLSIDSKICYHLKILPR